MISLMLADSTGLARGEIILDLRGAIDARD